MRRARAEHKIELFVVDPIQMVSVLALHGLSRDHEFGHVARELKRFADQAAHRLYGPDPACLDR
jgi:hypothetical protein